MTQRLTDADIDAIERWVNEHANFDIMDDLATVISDLRDARAELAKAIVVVRKAAEMLHAVGSNNPLTDLSRWSLGMLELRDALSSYKARHRARMEGKSE